MVNSASSMRTRRGTTATSGPSSLEKALLEKLEGQRDFSAEYRGKFPHGGLRDQDASTGALPQGADWCLSHGFTHRTVQRWCGLLDPAQFTAKKNAILERCWQLAEMWQAANYMSESIEWYTPARYLEATREVLGSIDLDPASSSEANAVVGATVFFTEEDDGLAQSWHGRVFVNPPYGKTEAGESVASLFCNKAIAEYEKGNIEACVILVNSSHSQNWQAPLYNRPVCFVDHRIKFTSADGNQNKNPTFQNVFVFLGDDQFKRRFAETFHKIGYVMEPING